MVEVNPDSLLQDSESIPAAPKKPKASKSNGHAEAVPVPAPAVSEPLPADDPFAAENFSAEGEPVPTGVDDLQIDVGVPSDEDFVLVSSDPKHYLKAPFLIVKATEGFGKTHFLLTPKVAAWVKSQPSLKKFVRLCHVYLYKVADGGYGLWLVKDSLDTWSVSELAVIATAKKTFARRYNDQKLRKAHTTDAIPTTDVMFPEQALTGADGLLKTALGEAFAIADINHPVLNRLLGKV